MAPRRNDENSREAILDAAAKLVVERGFHAVRVADIARACGTSTGTVHYYFAGKDDVLTEALRESVERAVERQGSELRAHDDARERLLSLIDLQLPRDGAVRAEWSIWLQYWAEALVRAELREAHAELYQRWSETVKRIIGRGQQQGVFRDDQDPEQVTRHFTALLDGAATQVMVGAAGATVASMRALLVDYVDSLTADAAPAARATAAATR
jgi:AcrR family transcriptional regulator